MPLNFADLTALASAYVEGTGSFPVSDDIASATAAELKAQKRRLRQTALDAPTPEEIAADPTLDDLADLVEALCRRVARNLAMRKLPLGVQPVITDVAATGVQISGNDPEVRRLETPFRRRFVG